MKSPFPRQYQSFSKTGLAFFIANTFFFFVGGGGGDGAYSALEKSFSNADYSWCITADYSVMSRSINTDNIMILLCINEDCSVLFWFSNTTDIPMVLYEFKL